MLRRVAAFCRPLRPVLLLVSFPRLRSPVVGVLGLCWMWRGLLYSLGCPLPSASAGCTPSPPPSPLPRSSALCYADTVTCIVSRIFCTAGLPSSQDPSLTLAVSTYKKPLATVSFAR